jgi:cellulose synthase/poly-beta-1,6-N-acetylglucosamine synthase-like glycosyltransferase
VSTDLLVKIYVSGYALLALILALYGLHAYFMSFRFARLRQETAPSAPLPADPPAVTVQLPLFNEYYVVDRLLAAVCAFRYPRHRLEIQVLDDSTDETAGRVAQLVERYRAQGLDIVQIRRDKRTGYKGGALREGLLAAKGELIAVFDADFTPPPDFLLRTVGHFLADPGLGMVQARWGHLNRDYSALTRGQGAALDGHFVVEQTVRNRLGLFINFNGTAGIWRRECIESAGGWQDDTLTEDLDLSYRAQLAGWRFLFLPELACDAELPSEVNGFKGQQFRWAKGSMQTARKLLPRIARAPLPLAVKVQAFLHLTNHLVYPLLLLLAASTLPSLVVIHEYPKMRPVFALLTWGVVASFGHPIMYALAQRWLRSDWRSQLTILPVVIAGGMGIAVNNTVAVIEALRGRPSGFIRTPKYRIVDRSGHWRDKHYRAPASQLWRAELAFAAYVATAVVYAVATGHFAILPFLVLYLAGFLYIGLLSFFHARQQPERPRSATAAATAAA